MLNNIKVGIFDLTDCEGCELEMLNFREKFSDLLEKIQIINWRLAQDNKKWGEVNLAVVEGTPAWNLSQNDDEWEEMDFALIEGTPIKNEEVALLKTIRKHAKNAIALGTSACSGGIPALLDPQKRASAFAKVYPGLKYDSLPAKPISDYIKIDGVIWGCPVNFSDLEKLFTDAITGKIFTNKKYPVCLPCRARQNQCLLLKGKPCLGPITAAGCNAVCPSHGASCFGCLGPIDDANFEAEKNRLKKIGLTDVEIKNQFNTVWRNI